MAKITITNLCTPGTELFLDSESYLYELRDEELNSTQGGITPYIIIATLVFLVSGDTRKK
jgi:hypothetical protein